MRIGAQMSAAGGVYKAFARAAEAGCDTVMVFTKSNRQWKAKPVTDDDVEKFKKAQEEHRHITPVAVHASYLINIASPDDALWEKSYQALKDEVERAARFDIPLLTFHPGSFVSSDLDAGIERIGRGLKRLMAETADTAPNTVVCLETMAGQGTNIGHDFEHLARLLELGGNDPRLGVCFDTCHVFSAGHDFRTAEGYEKMLAEFDRVVGLDQIKCFHFNDSKHDLGERKDRHEHVGEGQIGKEGFAHFLNDPRWKDHPAHLETPKTKTDDAGNDIQMDSVNLETLRSLLT